jgi:hypothetical protein
MIKKVKVQESLINKGLLSLMGSSQNLKTPKCFFVGYYEMVHNFISDVYIFEEENKDMELTHYGDILKDNGLEWGTESMKNADVSNLNAQCVLALIMGAVRAERFCDGALLDFFKSGCILKWLERLNSIE